MSFDILTPSFSWLYHIYLHNLYIVYLICGLSLLLVTLKSQLYLCHYDETSIWSIVRPFQENLLNETNRNFSKFVFQFIVSNTKSLPTTSPVAFPSQCFWIPYTQFLYAKFIMAAFLKKVAFVLYFWVLLSQCPFNLCVIVFWD